MPRALGNTRHDETPAIRDVPHALGSTRLSGTPLRVVTLFQGATDTAVALGITPIGVVDSWSEKPTYRYLRPALNAVTHVGLETQPSLENIALLKPDLIVASRFRHEKIYPLLSQIAPTITLPEVYDFRQTLQMMGLALNRQEQASRLQADWDRRTDRLRRRLATHFGGRWPLTVSVIDIREDHLRLYLPASYAGQILSRVGFAWTPAAHAAPGVMLKLSGNESLPVADACLFFVFQRAGRPGVAARYQQWVNHPLWRRLTAVRNDAVYPVDSVAWSLSGGILGAGLMLDDIERLFQTPVENHEP